jgi:hypothetical protein
MRIVPLESFEHMKRKPRVLAIIIIGLTLTTGI